MDDLAWRRLGRVDRGRFVHALFLAESASVRKLRSAG
jgi:hypothetical protein